MGEISNPILERLGVDANKLDHGIRVVQYPDVVPGRVAHIDADFACYACSAETKDELDGLKPRKSFEDMCNNIRTQLEHLQKLCAAEKYVAHITPSGTTKGDRADLVVTNEYQANRKGVRPERLDELRAYVGEQLNSEVSLEQEADDAMAQANVRAIEAGESDLSVIVSKDKDLRMVPGLHWDFQTEAIVEVYGLGWLFQEQHKLPSGKMSPKKTLGWGTAYFWAQCLMGDTVDNISGLPMAHGDTLARLGVGKAKQRHRKVGPGLAFDVLNGLSNDRQMFDVVNLLYQTSPHEWVHWRTQAAATPTQALIGDMHALWMRQKPGSSNLSNWMAGMLSQNQEGAEE